MASLRIPFSTVMASGRCPSAAVSPASCFSSIDSKISLRRRRDCNFRRRLACQAYSTEATVDQIADAKNSQSELVAALKLNLFSAVSGLNRGLAASEDDLQKADAAARELEAAGGVVDLANDLDKLQGCWKLIYSSNFATRRTGPLTGRILPITLGQVFQRIDVLNSDFDNIVEVELGAPWPLPSAELTATLSHKFELIGSSKIKITFEKTTVKTRGRLSQLPPFDLPRFPESLRPPSDTRSGEFEVTYVDTATRITRGDGGELRIFVIS